MAWTKAKTAIVVGVGVLLAAGTSTVCVRQIKIHRAVDPKTLDESFWRFDLKTLISAPQVAAVRPSRFAQGGEASTDTRMVAHDVSLGSLLYYAYAPNNIYYQFPNNEYRTVLAPGVSDGKFDLLLTTTNHPQQALQAEIKKELGVVAHFEPRDVDVLVLKPADSASTRLTPSVGIGSVRFGRGKFNFTNQPAYTLVNFVQNNFDMLVDDQSGLTEQYTGSLKWNPQTDQAANQREIQTALSNQLGLELASGHKTIQMLVVEKAN